MPTAAQTGANAEPLRLDAKIPLGRVRGRIDHMAIDVAGQRLFVAELGNDSIGVVDLAARKTIRTIDGLAEPQGVGYVPSKDTIYVANARDGSVRLFRGADYSTAGRIDLVERIHETDQLSVGLSSQDCSIFGRSRVIRILEAIV